MDQEAAINLLENLGCRRIRVRGPEVSATCPNETSHDRGQDRHPSFSARIDPDGPSPFLCYACNDFRGTLEWLGAERGFLDVEFVQLDVDERWFTGRHLFENHDGVFFPPESNLKKFAGSVPGYVLNRGFSVETAKYWELGFDQEFDRAIFVVRDVNQRLRGVSGRAIYDRQKPKYLHYSWDNRAQELVPFVRHDRGDDFVKFEKSQVCYGEHLIARGEGVASDCVVVCEGHFDAIRLWEAGFAAAALMGSSPTDRQVQTLVELMPRRGHVTMAFDPDSAGRKCRDLLTQKLLGRVPLFEATFPTGYDPASVRDLDDLRWIIHTAEMLLD
jgi:hypothetical protein